MIKSQLIITVKTKRKQKRLHDCERERQYGIFFQTRSERKGGCQEKESVKELIVVENSLSSVVINNLHRHTVIPRYTTPGKGLRREHKSDSPILLDRWQRKPHLPPNLHCKSLRCKE
jgi:hypothetical protein